MQSNRSQGSGFLWMMAPSREGLSRGQVRGGWMEVRHKKGEGLFFEGLDLQERQDCLGNGVGFKMALDRMVPKMVGQSD